MARTKQQKRSHDDDDDDDGYDDLEDTIKEPKSKKPKQSSGKAGSVGKQALDNDGNVFWELSTSKTSRRASISNFKGSLLVNIREYYEKDEKFLPGKKGISLTIEQYHAFLKAIPQINEELKKQGVDVNGSPIEDDEGASGRVQKTKKSEAKPQKSNIETTSDEDED